MSTNTNALNLSEEVLQRRVFRPDILKAHAERFMLSQTGPFVKGKTVIDVGAAVGMYSYVWSQIANTVHSFEPVPPVFEQLRKTAENTPNWFAYNKAVGAKSGTVDFWVDDKRLSNSGFRNLVDGQKIEVDCITLEEYFTGADFIKIDVEGNELDVLEGGSTIITQKRPVLMIEIYHKFNNGPISNTFQYLMDLDYKIYYNLNTEPGLRLIESIDHALDIAMDDELGKQHDYDFLFIPKE